MGYFDSPKNRALWARELETLHDERQARKDGIAPPLAAQEQQKGRDAPPVRERVTYEQLLNEERGERQRRFEKTRSTPAISRTREKTKEGPEL